MLSELSNDTKAPRLNLIGQLSNLDINLVIYKELTYNEN